MKKRIKPMAGERGLLQAAGRGTGLALGLCLVLTALFAGAISREWVPESAMGYGAAGILLLSAGAGAYAAGRWYPAKGAAASCLGGLGYFLVLLLLGALFFGGRFHGILVSALLILGAVGAAVLLSARRGKGRKRKYKRYGL